MRCKTCSITDFIIIHIRRTASFLIWKLPEADVRKIEMYRSFDELYVIIYIILTYSAFVGIT